MLFHDEIGRIVFGGSDLICHPSETTWHFPNQTAVGIASRGSREDFVQFSSRDSSILLRSREVSELSNNSVNSGLWTCQLGSNYATVGIYQRGGKILCDTFDWLKHSLQNLV